jgi:superfamily I DNA/RNA helicase
MIVSFTRTAAFTIATKKAIKTTPYTIEGEAIDVNEHNVGTLHKICFHALNSPMIAETKKDLIAQWNEQYPKFAITGQNLRSVDNVYSDGMSSGRVGQGDELLNALNIKRNKMIPEVRWQPILKNFKDKWNDFKQQVDAVDFTDLIEKSITELPYAPGLPQILFVDEAQDFTILQLKLCRSWAQHMDYIVLCGDDDQTIFRFSGASPEAFLNPPVPDNMKQTLKQSYRVPQAVLNRAMTIIEKVKFRQEKDFKPRLEWYPLGDTAEGQVFEKPDITWQYPEPIIPDIKDKLEVGLSVMILATCSFMLKPVEKLLRDAGLPFSNKYRRSRIDWNPLYGGGNGISAAELLRAFFNKGIDTDYWSVAQFVTWADYLKVNDDGLKKKVGRKFIKDLKLKIEEGAPELHSIRNMLDAILTPTAVTRALNRDINWLLDNVKKTRREGLEYPAHVYRKYGLDAIETEPKITIGTVHSVKGGESGVVYVFPDISYKADQEFQLITDAKDSMYRLFYVAMTRAKHELILCGKSVKTLSAEEKMFVNL